MVEAKDLPVYNYTNAPSDTEFEYIPLSRIIFAQDHKEGIEIPKYKRGPWTKAYVVKKRGDVPKTVCETEEYLIPTVQMATYPTWGYDEITYHSPDIINKTIDRGIEAVYRQQDVEVVKILNASITKDHSFTCNQNVYEDNPNKLLFYILKAIATIVEHEVLPAYILMHPSVAELLYLAENKYLYLNKHVANEKDVYTKGTVVFGTFRDIPILTCWAIPKNVIYITSSPYKSGILVTKKYPSAREIQDNLSSLRKECLIDSESGFGVMEDYCNSRVVLDGSNYVKSEDTKQSIDIAKKTEEIAVPVVCSAEELNKPKNQSQVIEIDENNNITKPFWKRIFK